MAPTEINVRGSATISHPAERAILDLEVSSSSSDQTNSSRDVITTVNDLQAEIDKECPRLANGEISPISPISLYTIASLTTSSHDEYDEHGVRKEQKLYKASTDIVLHFRDFKKLGEMVVYFSTVPFVSLQAINWKLSEERQAVLEEQVRADALRHAIKRAHNYAEVIGKPNVTPVKIHDAQQFPYFDGVPAQAMRKVASTKSFGIGVGIDFQPKRIEVKSELEVDFHAE